MPDYPWGSGHGRGERNYLSQCEKDTKPLAPQFPLAEPACLPDFSAIYTFTFTTRA